MPRNRLRGCEVDWWAAGCCRLEIWFWGAVWLSLFLIMPKTYDYYDRSDIYQLGRGVDFYC